MVVSLRAEARYDMHVGPELVQWKNITKIFTRCALYSFKHMETRSGISLATALSCKVQPLCVNESTVCPRGLSSPCGGRAHD